MNQLVYQINNNSIMTAETFKVYLKDKTWNIHLAPIDNEVCPTLYQGSDLDMIIGTISTPNWGLYIITQVPEKRDESLSELFGFTEEPTIYSVKCYELM